MKRILSFLACVVFTCCIVSCAPAFAGPRDAQWQKVDEAARQGLPRTAITNLEPIIQAAMKDKAYAEATRAIARKITLEGQVEGGKPEERITRMQAEITRAPKEMVPMLETLLAEWYWQYFQQNRWRFMQRTATGEPPGEDFTTWDLARLFAEIDLHWQKALGAEAVLKATPVAAWDDLLVKGSMSDTYRPTLYDFIAHEALAFYSSGEQAVRPQDAFAVPADSPVFDTLEQFIAWQPASSDTNSTVLKAVRLFQDLLRFHQHEPAPQPALANADLERLKWAWNTAYGDEEKTPRYRAALKAHIERWGDLEVSARALHDLARLEDAQGNRVEARQLALEGVRRFPDSPGGRLCRNLVLQIEAPSSQITTEKVWNAPWPKITVHYRNVTAVYLRAIPVNWETFLERRRNRPENLSSAERRALLQQPAAREWSAALPPTTNYLQATFDVPAPEDLKPGFYFIAASHDPQFAERTNAVSMADVWVSDLALVTRTREGNIEGFVLDANSGEPMSGAEIDVWHLDNRGNRIADPMLATDTNGLFTMKPESARGYLFRARHNGHELASSGDLQAYAWNRREPYSASITVLFTDRAIYRPGQMIQYKGICLRMNQANDNYEVLANQAVTIVFSDPNNKEIARQQHRANEYGSFAGSFTAPRDRLMGPMSLRIESGPDGDTTVRVEEYKRPKFEVTLDPPKTAPRLQQPVAVTGRAINYTGAAVDGAAVRYRVVRQAVFPLWRMRWGWHPPYGQPQEIANGTAQTDVDGTFTVGFVAKPDPQASEKDEPLFSFTVHADVTDAAGETRSADRNVNVGFTALRAELTTEDWQTADQPVMVSIRTTTLDNEPQAAEGSVKVYRLRQPSSVHRPPLTRSGYWYGRDRDRTITGTNDLSDPNNWELADVAAEHGFTTDTNGTATLSFRLAAGVYRAVLETQDRFGKKVTWQQPVQVLEPDAAQLGIRIPQLLAGPRWSLQPGDDFTAVWGTGYPEGRAFIEIEHRGRMIERYWTRPSRTQQQIKMAVAEAMRGGFTLHVTQVRENRAYLESRHVDVPWRNKELDLRWEHFTSKLQPGAKETWTLVMEKRGTGVMESWSIGSSNTPTLQHSNTSVRNAPILSAELAAALYDASLDAFAPHQWLNRFDVFYRDTSTAQFQFWNLAQWFQPVFIHWDRPTQQGIPITYRHFPQELAPSYGFGGYLGGGPSAGYAGGRSRMAKGEMVDTMAVAETAAAPASAADMAAPAAEGKSAAAVTPLGTAPQPDLSQVTARKNLTETAFFYPQLLCDSNGVVRITFTMPEALTKWRFLGFAHDRALRSGYLEGHTVTAKDLMVQPNPPRFLREDDTIEFSVKVSNQSDKPQTGRVRLTFADAATGSSADKLLGNAQPEQPFDIPAKESRGFAWRIHVPDGCGFLTYQAVAATASLSDGEEGAVPVLSRRIFITESLPLPIRGPATKKFEFTKLLESGRSKTLQNQNLVVQMVSNPAWYAVLALPYLMEFPYECSEQMFNRFYANALARHIANSDPKIRAVFDQWKNTPALDSPLEKNQDLKSVMLEETPWLRQAHNESQARRNVGILFDENRLNYETQSVLRKLADMQLDDGLWPWFPGGRGSDYITLYIVTGFGRLRHLGVDIDVAPATRALSRLDGWMTEQYQRILKRSHPEEYVPSSIDALYLYGRSFFLKDQPIAPPHQKAVDFFLGQSRRFWLQTQSRQTQGHLALALKRFGGGENAAIAQAIMKSLRERSVTNEELGRFWRDTEESWWWYRAPIETQALMIEAFDEVAGDQAAVEECRVWLLKQKQTQNWKTTKATADAVYSLLLRGADLLSSTALVEVKLDNVDVTPHRPSAGNSQSPMANRQAEPGTGFYEYRFAPAEIKPALGRITVRKVDAGVAWGGVHWQYLEDMSKVTPHTGTPLKLNKALYTKANTPTGPVLQPVSGAVQVGDELVVRVELRVDRDMEYVHLKDQRGSGTEPVNVLSRYRYQDGLGYYESTRDTASHFFIDYLPKGAYVFEYSTRVQLRGEYQTGVAEIQCMYAPEFNSHSQSIRLVAR